MRDLILSLSLEATDHDRRTRVKDIFYEALSRPNGMPKRFTDLFDTTLTQVGEEVQSKAKKRFFDEAQAGVSSGVGGVEEENTTSSKSPSMVASGEEQEAPAAGAGDDQPQWKYPEELQLWALIDVMVQSKTIVKKAEGKLGSKGSFQ
jgi:hypothetical protein